MSEYDSAAPVQTPEPPPQDSPPLRKEPPRTRRGGWMGPLALLFSFLALVLAAAALYVVTRVPEEEPPPPPPVSEPEPVTFRYRDRLLEVVEGLPVSRYDGMDFLFDENGRASYAQGERRARLGIDVSFYQGDSIDWPAVAADGVEFVMIRLGYRGYTEGGLKADSCFQKNIQGALDAGLDVGVYFFSQAVTPQESEEEADFAARMLEGYSITYPVAFDWEYIDPDKGARTNGMTGETLTQCAKVFCQRLQEKGYTPAVYFNQDLGYLTYDLTQLTEFVFWLAEYDGPPDFYYDFQMWQYTHKGKVEGIQGNVDFNLDLRPAVE